MAKLEQSKHAKKVHVIEVVCAVLVAAIPKLFSAVQQEYRISIFPPLYCSASPAYVFYGTILPTVVVSCATLIMMVIILYYIHIVSN